MGGMEVQTDWFGATLMKLRSWGPGGPLEARFYGQLLSVTLRP